MQSRQRGSFFARNTAKAAFRRSLPLRKDFYDTLRGRQSGPAAKAALFGRLPNLIALALSGAGWARQLDGVDPNSVTSREAPGTRPAAARRRMAGAARQRSAVRRLRHLASADGRGGS